MESLRSPIILSSVVLYMCGCVGIGLWAMRRTRSSRDFFMAGRNLGVVVTAVAMFSTTMSGFGFVGGPGLMYRMGMSSAWMVLSSAAAIALSGFVLAKRLRLFAELGDSVSLPDAVALRYGSESTRLLTALAILLGVLGYLATQILAMAAVLQSILRNTLGYDEVSLTLCMAISVTVLLFYSVTGGIIASVYTDLFQGGMMVVAGLAVFLTAVFLFDGGIAEAATTIMRDDPAAMSPWGTLGIVGALSWYFLFMVGALGQPHVITKYMMLRRVEDAPRVVAVTAAGYMFPALLWIAIGLAMRALVLQGAHPELANPDDAAAQFLQVFAHPLLAGVVFAGLFAAIMSTADAFLNIGAAAVIHDIPKALGRRTADNELFRARVATVTIGCVAALFALYSFYWNDRLVALLGAFGWSTFAAALIPTVAIGFNWKRATARAANTAIVASLAINLAFELGNVSLPYGVSGGVVAVLASLLLFFAVSYTSRADALDPDIETVMDL